MVSIPSPHRARIGRLDLGSPRADGGFRIDHLATICHFSDLHVLDAVSPMRFEWIQTLAHDPLWRPLLHMHRPQESLVPWAVAAHLEALRADPAATTWGEPVDLVLCTGDNIDNAQYNELRAYLALMAGGRVALPVRGSVLDASDAAAGSTWPYWSPLASVPSALRDRGFPVVDDFFERVAEGVESPGVGLPWASLPGNHDLLCQGAALVNAALARVAVGARKGVLPPAGFAPADPLALFVDEPQQFLAEATRTIVGDVGRRPIDLAEWLEAHVEAGALGYSPAHVARQSADAVVELEQVSVVMLDTNHPAGNDQGSVGQAQLDWLDEVLTRIDDTPGRLAVLASHHGVDSLVNTHGDAPDRRLGDALLAVVHRHPCVVAWLVGHRHVHQVTARPGPAGGFYEITTASIIDWPVERRVLEIFRHDDGLIEIVSTVDSHGAAEGTLAALHRELAHRFGGRRLNTMMEGTEDDRDVRMYLHRPLP